MQQHATSPGPQANPAPHPPASSPPRFPLSQDQSPSSYQTQAQHHQQQYQGLNTSNGDQHASQSSFHVQQQQQARKQEEEVRLLHQQLQEAKADAEALAEENERLMEMSNALRSECERSVTRPQQHLMPVISSGAQGGVRQPLPLAPELQPQQVYYQPQQAYPLGPQSMSPRQPLHPHAMQWATQGMPHQGFFQHPQPQQPLISGQVEGSSQQAWHGVQQPLQPAGQLAASSGQHQNGLALTMPDDPLPPEVQNQNSQA